MSFLQRLSSGFVQHVPSFNDMNTLTHEPDTETTLKPTKSLDAPPRKSNKADAWPQFETVDYQKVQVADHTRAASHLMDVPRAGHRSVWEEILHSKSLSKGDTTMMPSPPTPSSPPDSRRSDQQAMPVPVMMAGVKMAMPKDSKAMMMSKESKGHRIGEAEYKDWIEHYGSE